MEMVLVFSKLYMDLVGIDGNRHIGIQIGIGFKVNHGLYRQGLKGLLCYVVIK